jgi:hypothetical protein
MDHDEKQTLRARDVAEQRISNRMSEMVRRIETLVVDGPKRLDREHIVLECASDVRTILHEYAVEQKAEMMEKREPAFVMRFGRPSAEVREAYLARITELSGQGLGHRVHVEGYNPEKYHHFNVRPQHYEKSKPTEEEVEAYKVTAERCYIDPDSCSGGGWQ